MLSLETEDRRAFEAVLAAFRAINRYRSSGNRTGLDEIFDKLDEAIARDSNYLLPRYYRAIVDDLLGRSDEAANVLSELIDLTPVSFAELRQEMRLNLAAAQYHGYYLPDLSEAAQTIERLLQDTENPRDRRLKVNSALSAQSHALRAQVLATSMIPELPEDMNQPGRHEQLEATYKEVMEIVNDTINDRRQGILKIFYKPDVDTLALSRHTRALANMYYTDYLRALPEIKLKLLDMALDDLLSDAALFPGDTAYYCDLASCYLRRGYWGRDQAKVPTGANQSPRSAPESHDDNASSKVTLAMWDREFRSAERRLETVLQTLRPKYGFALFELGRVYRLRGEFGKSCEFLGRSKDINERDREVSDKRVEREVRLADEKSMLYP